MLRQGGEDRWKKGGQGPTGLAVGYQSLAAEELTTSSKLFLLSDVLNRPRLTLCYLRRFARSLDLPCLLQAVGACAKVQDRMGFDNL